MARIGWLRDQWIKPDVIGLVRRLKPIADELGISRAHLALAWVLRQRGVSSAITGATKVEHITSNIEAVGLKLDAEVLDKIDETLGNKPEPPEL